MALPATNLTLHLDASDTDRLWKETGMSTHPADGEAVVVWDDEGDATNFALFSFGGSPVYRANGINGLGSLDYTAGNSMRGRTDNNASAAAISNFITNTTYTCFIAFQMQGNAGNRATTYDNAGLLWDEAQFFGLHAKTVTGVHTLMAYNWDGSDDHANMTFLRDVPNVAMFKHASGVLSLDINNTGSPATASSGNTSNVGGQLLTGYSTVADDGYDGMLGEIAIYNANLTGSDLSDAWAYFIDKWVTPPATGAQLARRRFGGIQHQPGRQGLSGVRVY